MSKTIGGVIKIPSNHLSLAGEFRVCSELQKRSVHATVTYGNMKGVDIFIVANDGLERKVGVVEVKSSNSSKFVTNLYQKYKTSDCAHPTFWVLCSMSHKDDVFVDRFFCP